VVTGLERTILETDDAGEDDAEGPRNGRCESSYRLQQATKDTDEMEMKLKVRKKNGSPVLDAMRCEQTHKWHSGP
jgi:hypothetical protein